MNLHTLKSHLTALLVIGWTILLNAFDLEVIAPPQHADMIWTGHVNPDCDSLGAAFGAAALYGGQVRIAGVTGPEARFVLRLAGLPMPESVPSLVDTPIGLVDHNQSLQSPPGIRAENIICIIDHHGLTADSWLPAQPVSADFRPWQAASAIVADRFLKSGRPLEPSTALLLLCGILSDAGDPASDKLSPREREIISELAGHARVADVQALQQAMLKAKSDYSMFSAREVLLQDYKEYALQIGKVGFALAETLDPAPLLARREEFNAELKKLQKERGLDLVFFAVKDLSGAQAYLLNSDAASSRDARLAYGRHLTGALDAPWLKLDKTSRKKFLIPRLAKLSARSRHAE